MEKKLETLSLTKKKLRKGVNNVRGSVEPRFGECLPCPVPKFLGFEKDRDLGRRSSNISVLFLEFSLGTSGIHHKISEKRLVRLTF